MDRQSPRQLYRRVVNPIARLLQVPECCSRSVTEHSDGFGLKARYALEELVCRLQAHEDGIGAAPHCPIFLALTFLDWHRAPLRFKAVWITDATKNVVGF